MGVIKDLPPSSRPREKALILGLDSLSNDELLALIISSGYKGENALEISKRLFKENINLTTLASLDVKELSSYRGVKEATALKIAATFTLAKRINIETIINESNKPLDDKIIAKNFANEMSSLSDEKLVILLLNKKKILISKRIINIGNKQNVKIEIDKILKVLFTSSTYYFYLLHNHPNGSYNSSVEDIIFTHRIKDIAKQYKRYLLDHLIFTNNGCYSMGKNEIISTKSSCL